MAQPSTENATPRRASTRPRIGSLRGTPSSQALKIASSYNLHDPPIYEPMTPDDEEEDFELDDVTSPDTMAAPTSPDTSRKASTVKERKQSVLTQRSRRKSSRQKSLYSVKDPSIVTWDGPDDPANPKNWPLHRKWLATVIVSFFTFMAPVTSSMIAPSLDQMAKDLHVESTLRTELMLSIFVLAFALGPLIFGPLSEIYGRVPVLQLTNGFYLIWNLACGFAQTESQMLAFRFLSGLGGSAPSAVGGGVLGDCWRSEQRGKAVAAYSLAPLLGPAIGPIFGGLIASNVSWRWVFWASCIFDGVVQTLGYFLFDETYAPKLLQRKAERLRKETGDNTLHTEYELRGSTLLLKLGQTMIRPFRLLGTQPIIQVLGLYLAYVYGLTYLVYATFTQMWQYRYHESMEISGLNYISLSIGFSMGSQVIAPLNDWVYAALKQRNNGVGRPEFRCPIMLPGSISLIIGLFWYGWTAQERLHWILPNIGIVFFSAGSDISSQCITTYLIDSYTRFAASALAAAMFLRSLAGFAFPLFAPFLYRSLGYGWGNSLLGITAIVIGLPAPGLLWLYGPKLRSLSRYAAGD